MKPVGEGLDRNETPAIGPTYNRLRSAGNHRSGMISSGIAICGIASGRSKKRALGSEMALPVPSQREFSSAADCEWSTADLHAMPPIFSQSFDIIDAGQNLPAADVQMPAAGCAREALLRAGTLSDREHPVIFVNFEGGKGSEKACWCQIIG